MTRSVDNIYKHGWVQQNNKTDWFCSFWFIDDLMIRDGPADNQTDVISEDNNTNVWNLGIQMWEKQVLFHVYSLKNENMF